jgi:imidazolonepropionase-like amidohydrolase
VRKHRVAGPIACLVLAGCATVDRTPATTIIGGTLIDGTGGAPVPESVVLVFGSRIREAGSRANVPTPAGARNIDARGKFVTPRMIDLGGTELAAADSNEELRKLLDSGIPAYGALPPAVDPALLNRLREARAVFAPGLSRRTGEDLTRAMRQTRALAIAGVFIGVASSGDPGRELHLLAEAGLTPMEVLVAATRNGALAKRQNKDSGTVAAGKFANLLLLAASPLDDVRNLTRAERVMEEGRWVK